MTKQDLIDKLLELVKLNPEAQRHAHYDRVCELATLYSQIISGKDIDKLLRKFVRREDDVMFEQRVNLTQQTTPSIANGIMKTFNKVFRTKPSREVIDFTGDSVDKKVQEIKEALSKIYGHKDIYKYLQDRFLYLTFCDPNAFIYTTFKSFDAKKKKPEPYNLEITSEAAINYEYFNNVLQWLVSKVCHTYMEEDKERDGFIYTIYGPEWAFVLTQVGKDYVAANGADGKLEVVMPIVINEDSGQTEYYIYTEYNHKSVIPVIQVGYERDLQTKGETFVSPIEPGVPYFQKLIKTVSEFDLTNCLHVFPKLFQYVEKCSFKADGKCETSGVNVDRCKICNKSGTKLHGSAQDAIILPMPKHPEDMMDMSKMIHVETPAVELLEFQFKLIETYGQEVNKSVFNAKTLAKSGVENFATGLIIDEQNVYDTLKPFAEKVSDVWIHVATVSSYYLDYKDPIVDHAYPEDFKLKTIGILIDELNKAQTGGASGYVTSCVESDIMRQMYIDSPLEYQKYEARQKFFPFKGKNSNEIQQIILSGIVRENDVILYNYFELIFSELEDEFMAQKKWFYDLDFKIQKEAIRRKVKEIKNDIGVEIALSGEMLS